MFAFTFSILLGPTLQNVETGAGEEKRNSHQLKRKFFWSKQRTVSLIQRVLFMDQLLRIENKLLHSHSDTQRFIKLKHWACASCSFLRVLCEQNHTAVLKRIKTVHCLNGYFHQAESVLCFFLSQLPCSMPLMLVGAPFESSSMLCTYPRTTKPSKQRRKGT